MVRYSGGGCRGRARRGRCATRRRGPSGHRTFPAVAPATLGDSFQSFFDAVDDFVSNLASVRLGPLVLALLLFTTYLTLRARASFNILRATYPNERIQFREIWGAYFAGYGFNAVIPARGGDVVRLFLTKTSVPNSSYPAVAATLVVELIFDAAMGSLILLFAFTQGVFPKPPDFAKLNAFDLSYLAQHPRFALFLITALAIGVFVAFALLSVRVKAFWERVRQGFTILRDRRRYLREVFAVQFVGWLFRFAAFWALLEAFNVGGSVKNVLLVLGVNAVSAAVPFTPQGAGVQQALLAKVFGGGGIKAATVAAYSVGQQIAIGALTFGIGFAALVFIFRVRSFKEVVARGRADRADEVARRDTTSSSADPSGPPQRPPSERAPPGV
ncbi:MAG: flippase-like domain-containing protein [Thermoleophilaceae bacterium]|nr:flippase-like domain-containing protein [Thermoleophilaceae bacterium]